MKTTPEKNLNQKQGTFYFQGKKGRIMTILLSMLKCQAYKILCLNSGIQRSLCNAIKHDHKSNISVHKFPTITNGWK